MLNVKYRAHVLKTDHSPTLLTSVTLLVVLVDPRRKYLPSINA